MHLSLVVIVRLRVRLRRTGHTREVGGAGPRDKLVQQQQCFVSAQHRCGAMKRTTVGGLDAPSSTLLFKSRAETQKALGEKEKAESECIHAKLKLDQMQAHLDIAQGALHARAQDRRAREVQGVFDQADQEYRVRMAKAAITARLLSRSPGKNGMDRLKARKTPVHRTDLTRSLSRVVNRAPGAHALRRAQTLDELEGVEQPFPVLKRTRKHSPTSK
jgi:hypothetical protein